MATVRWGMLPTANIGRLVAAAARRSRHAEVVAVASRDGARARAFADELGLPTSYASYDALLASEEIDAVHIALPVSMHTEWTDLRLAATLSLPRDVLAQFDVGLDLTRRDELELIGTEGKLTIPDPWLCRTGYLELERDGVSERLPVDPAGDYDLTDPEHDAYRIELDAVSAAILDGTPLPFGRADAVAQASVLDSLLRSGADNWLVPSRVPGEDVA
jgi:predicted dehydrogenase